MHLLTRTLSQRYEVGMDSYDRLFPNQDTLPKGGFGNLIALPLQRAPRKNGNSLFIDENFVPYIDQWHYLSNVKKMKLDEIQEIVKMHYQSDTLTVLVKESGQKNESPMLVPNQLKILEKNGLFIEKENLHSSFLHKLIQLATFKNPEFYKAQSKRLSTYGIPRNINCSEETDRYMIFLAD